MILATVRSSHSRHGALVVVSRDHQQAVFSKRYPTLLQALESWNAAQPELKAASDALEKGKAADAFALDLSQCLAPLPFSYGFYDGSAFLSHVVRARAARGDKMPESARKTPLMYQGVSDYLLPWNAPLDLMDPQFGGDFEGEFAAITCDLPKASSLATLEKGIALFVLFNDITYREIVKTEIETKFGFLQSKPNSSFAPFAITPDELGNKWDQGRIHCALETKLNGKVFGTPNGREMHFSFPELLHHANRTRPLAAGTIVGTGTVSNEDAGAGFACLTEKRFQEILDTGHATTPWLKEGDHVEMEVREGQRSLFGKIDQRATAMTRPV